MWWAGHSCMQRYVSPEINSKISNFKTQWYAMAQYLEKGKCYININSPKHNVHRKLEWNVITDYLSHNFSSILKQKPKWKPTSGGNWRVHCCAEVKQSRNKRIINTVFTVITTILYYNNNSI